MGSFTTPLEIQLAIGLALLIGLANRMGGACLGEPFPGEGGRRSR
jgi:hypothetical protein